MGPYPSWNHGVTPRTDPAARVRKHRAVQHRHVIRVTNASYRSAVFDGVFDLEEQGGSDPIRVTPKGKSYARVVCAWYGVTPDTEFPGIDLSSAEYELLADFSGDVVDDIY
jgi:hypothetical protein